jgi:hypothetical protein
MHLINYEDKEAVWEGVGYLQSLQTVKSKVLVNGKAFPCTINMHLTFKSGDDETTFA